MKKIQIMAEADVKVLADRAILEAEVGVAEDLVVSDARLVRVDLDKERKVRRDDRGLKAGEADLTMEEAILKGQDL